MSAGALAVTLGPQLVALVTGSANPPSNGTCCAGAIDGPPTTGTRPIIRVLAVPGILAPELGVLVDVHLLLKLLEGILRAVRQSIKSGTVQVRRGGMMGEHVRRGKRVVSREAVQRVGEHIGGGRRQTCQQRGDAEEVEKSVGAESKCRRPLYHRSGEQVNGTRRCGDGSAERNAMAGCAWRCWSQDSCSI